jgi:hypothetical protein
VARAPVAPGWHRPGRRAAAHGGDLPRGLHRRRRQLPGQRRVVPHAPDRESRAQLPSPRERRSLPRPRRARGGGAAAVRCRRRRPRLAHRAGRAVGAHDRVGGRAGTATSRGAHDRAGLPRRRPAVRPPHRSGRGRTAGNRAGPVPRPLGPRLHRPSRRRSVPDGAHAPGLPARARRRHASPPARPGRADRRGAQRVPHGLERRRAAGLRAVRLGRCAVRRGRFPPHAGGPRGAGAAAGAGDRAGRPARSWAGSGSSPR